MRTSPKSAQRLAGSPVAWTTAAVVAIVLAGWLLYTRGSLFGLAEEKVGTLDPAQVVVLRTPGGFLEVATLKRVEEFRWRSSYTCPWGDCSPLFGERIGRIKVPVYYTYRIPLAESWTLKLDGDVYVLSVPAPQPLLPPGIETNKAEFTSEKGGLLPPGAALNQQNLMLNLGPELAQRAQRSEYVQQQLPAAEKTVREFAEKWMKEQVKGRASRPVRVEFRLDH